uniref:Uncharacterized protein n=2 Tax=Grammatophora oceanica TaxID=210454 RepID=A0A7S1V0A4_9STRA|mmetsp:Transcript_29492/g.43501  ORF Transcript_29492/g.43501 Transcript_29492/m.43501 type:complete len:679 (+) Transcript_29492:134-2170(+)|eukprot:CAMPEP_0194052858 /NCGR_PEP_ID=MMETSP0009_2-20130614/47287_1 /TAXON_ID=210454 /ORGANISM="Grammatophora oceanica, Strain CCMP 410" /LENGTH=678 /DNA_ID=CAMNT_0038700661 /DNA_START=35 /DNA_END=2071 /DNA_ORIENTATION=+
MERPKDGSGEEGVAMGCFGGGSDITPCGNYTGGGNGGSDGSGGMPSASSFLLAKRLKPTHSLDGSLDTDSVIRIKQQRRQRSDASDSATKLPFHIKLADLHHLGARPAKEEKPVDDAEKEDKLFRSKDEPGVIYISPPSPTNKAEITGARTVTFEDEVMKVRSKDRDEQSLHERDIANEAKVRQSVAKDEGKVQPTPTKNDAVKKPLPSKLPGKPSTWDKLLAHLELASLPSEHPSASRPSIPDEANKRDRGVAAPVAARPSEPPRDARAQKNRGLVSILRSRKSTPKRSEDALDRSNRSNRSDRSKARVVPKPTLKPRPRTALKSNDLKAQDGVTLRSFPAPSSPSRNLEKVMSSDSGSAGQDTETTVRSSEIEEIMSSPPRRRERDAASKKKKQVRFRKMLWKLGCSRPGVPVDKQGKRKTPRYTNANPSSPQRSVTYVEPKPEDDPILHTLQTLHKYDSPIQEEYDAEEDDAILHTLRTLEKYDLSASSLDSPVSVVPEQQEEAPAPKQAPRSQDDDDGTVSSKGTLRSAKSFNSTKSAKSAKSAASAVSHNSTASGRSTRSGDSEGSYSYGTGASYTTGSYATGSYTTSVFTGNTSSVSWADTVGDDPSLLSSLPDDDTYGTISYDELDWEDDDDDDDESLRHQLLGLLKDAKKDPWRLFKLMEEQGTGKVEVQ